MFFILFLVVNLITKNNNLNKHSTLSLICLVISYKEIMSPCKPLNYPLDKNPFKIQVASPRSSFSICAHRFYAHKSLSCHKIFKISKLSTHSAIYP